jgi:hypothetical protein
MLGSRNKVSKLKEFHKIISEPKMEEKVVFIKSKRQPIYNGKSGVVLEVRGKMSDITLKNGKVITVPNNLLTDKKFN